MTGNRSSEDLNQTPGRSFRLLLQKLSPNAQSTPSTPFAPSQYHVEVGQQLPTGVQQADEDLLTSQEDVLNDVDDKYYEAGFDAVEHELLALGSSGDAIVDELSAIAEKRGSALDVVSDTLSMNILRDYQNFNKALSCIAHVQEVLCAAKVNAKLSREHLARASMEAQHGIAVWENAQKKKSISAVLVLLKKLQTGRKILQSIGESLETENYGGAVEQCSMCADITSELIPYGIHAAESIANSANELLCEIAEQMFVTLTAMTGQFDASRYASLMEGYAYLTDPEKVVGGADLSPSREIISAYCSAPSDKVKKVVIGVLYSSVDGATKGLDISPDSNLVDLISQVPSESFKLTMEQVLKVEYDILLSWGSLEKWHREHGTSSSEHARKILEEIREALPRGRKLIWNQISSSLMSVLRHIQIGHGDAFVQVSTWIQDFIALGATFSGDQSEDLHSILCQQSLQFFKRHHLNTLEALYAVLEKENYKVIEVRLPWLEDVNASVSNHIKSDPLEKISDGTISQFDDLMVQGKNPWDHAQGDGYTDPLAHIKARLREKNVTLGRQSNLLGINSLWRLVSWILEYIAFMRDLPLAAPAIALGLVDILDVFLSHAYATFIGPKYDRHTLYSSKRLEEYIAFVKRSNLSRFSQAFESWYPDSALVQLLKYDKNSKEGRPISSSKASNSGNLYGFVERSAVSSSIQELGIFLHHAKDLLKELHAESTVEVERAQIHFSTVSHVVIDLSKALYGSCCSLLLPTVWITEAVGSQGMYLASDPPSTAAPWTSKLARQLELLAAQLESVKQDVPPESTLQLWAFVYPSVSHAIIDGLSMVKKCTLEGRAAMSLDLQAVSKLFIKTLPSSCNGCGCPESLVKEFNQSRENALRFIDDYIKGFYVPLDDLHTWAKSHPSYTAAQVRALAMCIAESSGMKKKDIAHALEELDSHISN